MSVSAIKTAEVLIVEDDVVILNTLAYNLSRQGFGVQKATSGAEALKLARKLRPDLILLDPELAATSPERLWLSSGVRCVDHCVELMCNPRSGEVGYEGVGGHAERGLRCMIRGLTEYKEAKGVGERDEDGQGMEESERRRRRELLLEGISECQYGSREALTGLLIWRVPMGPSHAIGHQVGIPSPSNSFFTILNCVVLTCP